MLSNTHFSFEKEIQQDILSRFNRFKDYQSLMLKVLADFHRVCEKNGIQYFLAYGSLLGAIRDKGQIPWDYDIDTWVHFEDKERLFDALERDLSDDYYFVSRYYKKSAYHRILRITPKGYNSEVLHVDVFWLSGAPDDPKANKKQLKTLAKIRKISFYKYGDKKFVNQSKSRFLNLLTDIRVMVSKMIPDALLDYTYDKYVSQPSRLSRMINDGDTLYVVSDWFKDCKTMTVANGMNVLIPCEYEKILQHLYGDYRNYMPIWSRVSEFSKALDRIESLG